MRAPAAFAALPCAAGAASAMFLWPAVPPEIAVAGPGGAALALLAAIVLAADDDRPALAVVVGTGCFLCAFSLGSLAAERAYHPPLLSWYAVRATSEPAVVEGVLRDDAIATPQGVSLTIDVVRVEGRSTAGGVRLSVAGALAAPAADGWRKGRHLRLPAVLRRPTVHRNPGVPDEAAALARRGICLVGTVKSAALVETIARGTWLHEAAAAARARARQRLGTAIQPLGARSTAIATAILIGDRHDLDPDDERRLQEAGTYHVMAISGGNIAILAGLLMLCGRALFLPHPAAAFLTIAALAFYGQMTGPAPSVGRAVAAASIFLASYMVGHRGSPLNALAVAAVVAIAASPLSILDPGFLLSFGATLGILLGTPLLRPARHRVRGPAALRMVRATCRAGVAVVAATVCAEVAIAPIGASLFGRVTFAGLVLNLAAIPLMTGVQVSGGGVIAFSSFSPAIAAALARIAHLSASALVDSARLVDVAPWLSIQTAPPSSPVLLAYYAAALACLYRAVRRYALPVLLAIGAMVLAGPAELARDAVPLSAFPLRVVVLDVGQGDASLVSIGWRYHLIVDAGGLATSSGLEEGTPRGFDVGERVVHPAVRRLGASRLDALVLTHGDPDHVLGAPALLRLMRPRSVWEGVPVPAHRGLGVLRQLAEAGGATWRTIQAGDVERFGEVELRVLHPPLPDWERQRTRNEDSVVLEIRLGRVSIVLPGDVGKEGERAILPRLEAGRLTVLKAAHHGSATSSTPELLAALHPAAVVFSVGLNNRFGHPHPAVVARFAAIGSAMFRTDHDGAVFIETDGRTVQIRGWTGKRVQVVAAVSRPGDALVHGPAVGAGARTTTRRHDDTKED